MEKPFERSVETKFGVKRIDNKYFLHEYVQVTYGPFTEFLCVKREGLSFVRHLPQFLTNSPQETLELVKNNIERELWVDFKKEFPETRQQIY